MRPSVSVIIPLHNAARTVGAALDSLLEQSSSDWEALVVDDASTDDGARIVEGYAARDGRIRRIPQPWSGLAGARNTGILNASAPFLLFLDADDWLHPGALTALSTAAESSGAAFGATTWHDAEGRPLGWADAPSCPAVGLDQLLEFNRFPVHAQMIRRELLGDIRFDPTLAALEDHDLWLRLATGGVRWISIDEEVAAYRLRPRSMSRDFDLMARSQRYVLSSAFDRAARPGSPEADTSPERRARILQRAALGYATAASLRDPLPGCDLAASIFVDHTPCLAIDPEAAARAAHWMLPYADCRPPNAWSGSRPVDAARLVGAAGRWWRRCARERWGPSDLSERALRSLARLCVAPRDVAEAIARRAPADRPVVVLGLGRNARWLVPALAQRGLRFTARDRSLALGTPGVRIAGIEVPITGEPEPFDTAALHILTPTDDAALAARLPRTLKTIRWSEVQSRLAGSIEARLLDAWPTGHAHGPAPDHALEVAA